MQANLEYYLPFSIQPKDKGQKHFAILEEGEHINWNAWGLVAKNSNQNNGRAEQETIL